MSEHPIEGMMNSTMQKIREMVDVNTIIGDPVTSPDGTVIIPVSKVTYGFAAGGSDLPTKSQKDLFGGGSGAGISITPIAFLSIYQGDVKLLQVEPFNTSADRVISMVPEVVDKISALFKKNGDKKKTEKTKEKEPDPKTSVTPDSDIELEDPLV